MSTTWMMLIIAGALVIAGLAFYAGRLLFQVKTQQKKREQLQEQHIKNLAVHDVKVLDSVVIIVRAMKEEQCDISEGCWRLSVLLDSLKTSENLSLEFPAIFELYQRISHMPILEERKKLAKQERMKLDLERTKIENELYSDVFANLDLLHNYAEERLTALKQ